MDGTGEAQAELDALAGRLDALQGRVHHDFRVRPERRESGAPTWSVEEVHPLTLEAVRALAHGRGGAAAAALSRAAGLALYVWPATPLRQDLVDLAAEVERHVAHRPATVVAPSRPPASLGLRWRAREDLTLLASGALGTTVAVALLAVGLGTSGRGLGLGLVALPLALVAVALTTRRLRRRRRAWRREVASVRSAVHEEQEVVVAREPSAEELRTLGDRLQAAFDWAAFEQTVPPEERPAGVAPDSLRRVGAQLRSAAQAMGSDDLARVVRLLDVAAREVSDSWPHGSLGAEVLGCAQQARRTAGL